MKKSNPIVKKYLKNACVITAAVTTVTVGTLGFAVNNRINEAKKATVDLQDQKLGEALGLCSIIMIFASFFCFSAVSVMKKHYDKYSVKLTYKYLKNVLSKNPEMRIYSHILNNPKALLHIADTVAGELDEKTQQKIIDIIYQESGSVHSDRQYISNVHSVQNKVMKVLEDYMIAHPEFRTKVRAFITKAGNNQTYITKPTQYTR